MNKVNVSQSSRLITIVLMFGILLFSGLSLYVNSKVVHSSKENLRKYADSQMRSIVMDLDSKMLAAESALLTKSHTRQASIEDSLAIYEYLENLVSDLNFVRDASLDILDVNEDADTSFVCLFVGHEKDSLLHRYLFTSSEVKYEEPEDLDCFHRAMKTNEVTWSLPYEDSIYAGGDLIVTCYKKMEDRLAALSLDIKVIDLLEMMNKLQFYGGGQLYINVQPGGKSYALVDGNLVCVDYDDIHHDGYSEISCSSELLSIKIINALPMGGEYQDMLNTFFWSLLITLAALLFLSFLVHRSFTRAQNLLRDSLEKSHIEEKALQVIENELSIASKIQTVMLNHPDKPVRLSITSAPESNLLAKSFPAKEVGGDLYEYSIIGDTLFFCVGDVSGKGVPAAMVMTRCVTLFHGASANTAFSVADVLSFMNAQLCRNNDEMMFVTLWVGLLNLRTGHLRYASAGHNPPVLVDGNKSSFLEMKQGQPLGMFEDSKYEQVEISLKPHQSLVLYTDGITEAEDCTHELFGDDRLLEACASADSVCPEVLSHCVLKSVHDFVGDATQSDDITILSLSFQGNCAQLRGIDDVSALHDLCYACGCDDPDYAALVIEETSVNAFSHGFADFVCAEYRDGKFILTDNGKAFDMTTFETKDPADDVEGGRGIMLVRQLCSEINVERIDDSLNRTTLKLIKIEDQ